MNSVATTMRALRLEHWGEPPRLTEVPVPRPGPGEVLVEVSAAGLCHSDLHLMDWPAGTMPFDVPFTLGHETAGVVAALGAGAAGLEIGEPVLVYGAWGCGECAQCRLGHENACPHRLERGCGGIGRDGGLADYLLVPSTRLLFPLDGLDPAEAAPLTDAALTSFHAIELTRRLLTPDALVVVIGAGGLGHVAIQLLRATTDTHIAVLDLRQEAIDLAVRAGAKDAVQITAETDAGEVAAALGDRPVAAVVDFVGIDGSVALGTSLLAPGGQLTMVGAGGASIPNVFRTLSPDRTIAVATWGTRPELQKVLELARAGAVHTEIQQISLEDAPDAYRQMRAGKLVGRAVARPDRASQ